VKLVAQNYRSGELTVLDVPVPACKPGGVLVASTYSLISTGTEMMKVTEAKLSLLGKARQRPDQVRKVVDSVAQVGPVAAYQKVVNRLDSYTPLGYSLCGVVIQVGTGAEEFSVGDRVACAGNEHALHAEVNWVPTNLCVPVPDEVDSRHAAFATVGAIAMQGVRQAEVQLGETACVIGLGLVGQLVSQLLVAAGVRVVGVDPVAERVELAKAGGAAAGGPPSAEGIAQLEQALVGLTDGAGCDHIFLAAGGPSNDPVHLAARLARDRARVVDIGKCRLDLPWNEYYDKELDVRFSRSYGPGRYDERYELEGIDYPIGYVRWTERRNLACFLDLAAGRLRLEPLISEVFTIDDAEVLYERLGQGQLHGVGFLLAYPEPPVPEQRAAAPVARQPAPPPTRAPLHRRLRLGFVGAGSYATSMLLPHLAANEDVELARVATTTSLSAANAQRRFSFIDASTDTASVLDDESIDAVFIVTRHRTHADLTCQALERGKTVFVEKPLALTLDELEQVGKVIDATGNDRLMVGFNRRFSPMFVDLRSRFGAQGPALVRYLVNAGRLDPKSWYGRTATEGSRFEGEGGHFIDTVSWWLDALPTEVHALATDDPDDLLVNLRFDDGSVASIAYATRGNSRFPKETFEASAGGRTARLANFRTATVWSGRRRKVNRSLGSIDKGQRAEVQAFVEAVRSGGPMPIPLPSLVATTRATLAVSASRASRRPESL
jgi:predicted dehydrogenase/threonine dehydrogenase-like Zn-dependent dehydrogenase